MHRAGYGENETSVEITGSEEARELARDLIEELVTPVGDVTNQLSGEYCPIYTCVLRIPYGPTNIGYWEYVATCTLICATHLHFYRN